MRKAVVLILSREAALLRLKELKLPQVLSRMWDGVFPFARYGYESPAAYLPLAEAMAGEVAELANLLPLWVRWGEAVVGFCTLNHKYLEFFYEDAGEENPSDEVTWLGDNYQQFVTNILLERHHAGHPEEAAELATVFQYQYAGLLESYLSAWCAETDVQDIAMLMAQIH